ncbi:FG-GAP repeat protein [Polyangium aurulentum]|uniref:FG-GAP repeat protein n=1 Tax=Polyangium aurulentum TaxID=2567896 RepID=UPI0010AE8211|nr:FG-GAP repeat protein [Polyangium aurulentum]UQA59849.1 FG-GAP repeat protein [Polyangium aurulentum]
MKRMTRPRKAFAGAALLFMAACGPSQSSSEALPATRTSSPEMPSQLRAAYIAAVQREAPPSYAATMTDGRARLSNAAQRFVGAVDESGLTVTPDEESWQLGLRTTAFGCEGATVPVAEAALAVDGNRVELRRDGLSEWYLNGRLGVEQGFVLHEPPACAGLKTMKMAIDGDLSARLDDADGDGRGEAVWFAHGERAKTLSYTDLSVTDATGRALPAWFSLADGVVSVVLDDAAAVYPLAVDPLLWMEQAKVLASDGATDDYFGIKVALSGDTAFVGAFQDDMSKGAVYVFVQNGGIWTEQAKLVGSDSAAYDRFGAAVALSGDTALVGAWGNAIGANQNQGAAYVFVRSGGVWTEQAKLVASDGQDESHFGRAVSLSGDTALVGAVNHDVGGNIWQGSAYVFVRNNGVWAQQAQLVASDGEPESSFGYSVSLSGDTALVAASAADIGQIVDQGAAYVFVRNGATWTEQAKLVASDGAASDFLGYEVALSGDTAIVTAFSDDIGGNEDQGSAYVFVRNGATWTEQAKLVASDGGQGDRFGDAVVLSGDLALLGATSNIAGAVDQGAVYVFSRDGAVWTEQTKLVASDGAEDDMFGLALALSGNTLLVGAPRDDIGGNVNQGSFYVFDFPQKPNGDPCTMGIECTSGSCVGGVCVEQEGGGGNGGGGGAGNDSGSGGGNGSGDGAGCDCRTAAGSPGPWSCAALSFLGLALLLARRRSSLR